MKTSDNFFGYSSFQDLYKQNFNYMYRVALRIVRDEALAEDIAQESLFKAYKKIGKFRQESNIKTWLHRIAYTQSLMELRKNFRKHEVLLGKTPVKINDISYDLEQKLIDNQENNIQRIKFFNALENLSRKEQRIVSLVNQRVEYEKISRSLGIKANSAKTTYYRARLKLINRITLD